MKFFIENSADHGHQTEDGVRQSQRPYPEWIHHEDAVAAKAAIIPQIDGGRGSRVGDGVGHKIDVASLQWCNVHMRRGAESLPRGGRSKMLLRPGNVVLSTAYWLSIFKNSRIIHAINFIM